MAYVDLEKARELLFSFRNECINCGVKEDIARGILYAANELNKLPTADVEEVRRGEWKASVMSTGAPHCSLCNGVAPSRYTYCPNCGAKMDGERK